MCIKHVIYKVSFHTHTVEFLRQQGSQGYTVHITRWRDFWELRIYHQVIYIDIRFSHVICYNVNNLVC